MCSTASQDSFCKRSGCREASLQRSLLGKHWAQKTLWPMEHLACVCTGVACSLRANFTATCNAGVCITMVHLPFGTSNCITSMALPLSKSAPWSFDVNTPTVWHSRNEEQSSYHVRKSCNSSNHSTGAILCVEGSARCAARGCTAQGSCCLKGCKIFL